MRFLKELAFLPLIALPLIASAQDACRNGLTDLFLVESYTAQEYKSDFSKHVKLDVYLKNLGDKGIRMVDGSVIFQDILGRDILRIGIDPDLRVQPGATVQQDGLYSNLRLIDVDAEDVIVTTCIRGLVHTDGTVFKASE